MFTKELENIAKSFPEFMSLAITLQNPLLYRRKPAAVPGEDSAPKPLDTVAKALWFVIPFHFLAFFGLVAQSSFKDSVASIVLTGFLVLVALMWVGAALALIPVGKTFGVRDFRERAGFWVSGIVCTWFYTVLILAIANFLGWLRQLAKREDKEVPFFKEPWPDLTGVFKNLEDNYSAIGDGELFMKFGSTILAVILLALFAWKPLTNPETDVAVPSAGVKFRRNMVYLFFCWCVVFLMLSVSLFLADN